MTFIRREGKDLGASGFFLLAEQIHAWTVVLYRADHQFSIVPDRKNFMADQLSSQGQRRVRIFFSFSVHYVKGHLGRAHTNEYLFPFIC